MNEPPPRLDRERLHRAERLRAEFGRALTGVREITSNLSWSEFSPSLGETRELRPIKVEAPWIDEVTDELSSLLEDSGMEGRAPELAPDELWVVETALVRDTPRSILRGYMEPVLALPVLVQVPELVLYFLTIDGDDALLKREKHSHFGWHYHYLNWKKERSDRILSWDLRAKREPDEIAALFHESHAEGGGFPSRHDLWGARKRQSMHQACSPDLERWAASTFKQASNDAEVVWPLGRPLSLHPNAKTRQRGR